MFISGKAGSGGSGRGVNVLSTISSTSGTITFSDCVGGTATLNNEGLRIGPGGTVSAPIIIGTGLMGGPTPASGNIGLRVEAGTLGSSAITTSISMTGTGAGSSGNGIQVDTGGNIFVNDTGTMTLTGQGSLAAAATIATGVRIAIDAGTISGGNASTLNIIGTGGGMAATAGTNSSGISQNGGTISAGTLATSTANINIIGTGGHGTGGLHRGVRLDTGTRTLNGTGTIAIKGTGGFDGSGRGVQIGGTVTAVNGTVDFSNSTGGSDANANHGVIVLVGGSVNAKTITGSNILGGAGTGSNGFEVDVGGTLGSTANTTSLQISASATGIGSNNNGITTAGTIQIGNSGTLALTGTGSPNGGVGDLNNNGLLISAGTVAAGTGALSTANITLGGTGGTGGAGTNHGVSYAGGALSLQGVGALTFDTCTGGSGGAAGACRGVSIVTSLTAANGTIEFKNCQGGNSGDTNIGVRIGAATVTAPTIKAITNIKGGTSGGINNDGIVVTTNAVVGSTIGATPTTVLMTATGGGSNGHGITISGNGIIQVNDPAGATLTLNGTGSTTGTTGCTGILLQGTGQILGGNAAAMSITGTAGGGGAGTLSHGFIMQAGTIQAGTGAGSTANISFSGTGGIGSAGSNHGVFFSGGTATLNGTGTFQFINCLGGTGGASQGVRLTSTSITAVNGTVNFTSCQGGGVGNNNYGVLVASGIDAKIITGSGIQGGGSGTDNSGLFVPTSGVIGSAVDTDTITISATGGGGDNGDGIHLEGTGIIQVNNTGILSLTGNGSTTGSSSCFGINILAGSISGGTTASIALTGTGGGSAAGNTNYGISQSGGTIQTGAGLAPIALTGTGGLGTTPFAIAITAPGTPISTPASGTITFNGLGSGTDVIALDNMTVSSGSGAISFNGPVALLASTPTITTTGPIFFGSTIDNGFDLAVNAGGLVTFTGAIGGNAPLVSLTLAGSSFNVGGNITLSGPALTFPSPVVLIGDSNMTIASGGTVNFASTINGPHNFGVDSGATGLNIFNGALGGLTNLSSITVTGVTNNAPIILTAAASGDITFNQLISTSGAAGADVTLTSSGGTISVNDIDTIGTAGNGGNIFLQPGPGFSTASSANVPAGILVFTGTSVTSTATGIPGQIQFAPAGRTEPQSIATIAGMQNLTILGGTFVMGVNESMTVLGDLTIDPSAVTLSDIIALGGISITGLSITLNAQPPAVYLYANGQYYISPNAHIISGSTLFFSVPVVPLDARLRLASLTLSDLLFGGTVLNFDFVDFNILTQLIFDEVVATSQLARLLPVIRPLTQRVFPVYRVCYFDEPDERRCIIDWEPFIFDSDIMTDASREKLGL